jgi:hypothetical protein
MLFKKIAMAGAHYNVSNAIVKHEDSMQDIVRSRITRNSHFLKYKYLILVIPNFPSMSITETWQTFGQVGSVVQLPIRSSANQIPSAVDRNLSGDLSFHPGRIENESGIADQRSDRIQRTMFGGSVFGRAWKFYVAVLAINSINY